MNIVKAKNYLNMMLFQRLDVLATKQKKFGVGKGVAIKIVEADAVRFFISNSGTIGASPGTPEYEELVEFVAGLAVNAVDFEYSH